MSLLRRLLPTINPVRWINPLYALPPRDFADRPVTNCSTLAAILIKEEAEDWLKGEIVRLASRPGGVVSCEIYKRKPVDYFLFIADCSFYSYRGSQVHCAYLKLKPMEWYQIQPQRDGSIVLMIKRLCVSAALTPSEEVNKLIIDETYSRTELLVGKIPEALETPGE